VDPWAILAIAFAIATIVLLAVVARTRRTIDRMRAAAGFAGDPVANVDDGLVRALAEQRATLAAATDELARGRAATAGLGEAVGPGILTVDRMGRVVWANRAAATMLGRSPLGLRGRTVMEVFLDPVVEGVAASAVEHGTASTEIRTAGPDGPTIQVRARPTPDGGVWLFLDDLSEIRRLQRIRTEFIDNLSHELRTPLTTVSLLAETLVMDADAAGAAIPERMRDRIAKVEVETGHLVQMVNELLDLSRIEAGSTLQLVDGIDVGPLARDSAERLRTFAERQGVDLQVHVASDLPPVRADPARLGQVVINLVHNAVKFSPDGGIVTVLAEPTEGGVRIAVEDHGLGIPRADQDRVFERFYKVDRARQRPGVGGGTGLGLAIARHVIEQHGGRIWLTSDEGRGSTFVVDLPAVAATAA
jgi:two-component system phosphate regulon sensor histidine kinase PhoR